jgi:3-deoxy-manno-octulosonate cytidylyltransferase (CMP-KDO synthetase)
MKLREKFNIIGIIPARMGSSRFPGKPLAKIQGLSRVEHVYKRSAMSKKLKAVYVATCDKEIKEAVERFGGKAIMTSDRHERASDRVAEAMLAVEKQSGQKLDAVVMIQGDEPMVFPEMIDESIEPILKEPEVLVTNLMASLKKGEETDVNAIKIVVNHKSDALYFSRAPIPYDRTNNAVVRFKQVCIIPFRRDFLIQYTKLIPTPLEKSESVDMLRVLEHGMNVRMVLTKYDTYSVDTPDDLKRVEELMRQDRLLKLYKK